MDKTVARLLDANLNRAREGLRVVEDTARFVWNKDRLYRTTRALRHELHRITNVSYRDLVRARESQNDTGRTLKEGARTSQDAVVAANIRRAQEAVRVLEEYSKVFSKKAAPQLKSVRYRLYDLEKQILKIYDK